MQYSWAQARALICRPPPCTPCAPQGAAQPDAAERPHAPSKLAGQPEAPTHFHTPGNRSQANLPPSHDELRRRCAAVTLPVFSGALAVASTAPCYITLAMHTRYSGTCARLALVT